MSLGIVSPSGGLSVVSDMNRLLAIALAIGDLTAGSTGELFDCVVVDGEIVAGNITAGVT